MSDRGFSRISEAGGISGSHFLSLLLFFFSFFFPETERNTGGSLTQILQRNNDAVAATNIGIFTTTLIKKQKKQQFFRFGIMASMKQFILFYLLENLWNFLLEKTPVEMKAEDKLGAQKIPSCGATVNCELGLEPPRQITTCRTDRLANAVRLKMHVSHKFLG